MPFRPKLIRPELLRLCLLLALTGSGATYAAGPAARLGDVTNHGGAVVTGNSTVLIQGQPAARAGDVASCPIAGHTPAGPIASGSASVLIGGQPAARTGDVTADVIPAVITSGAATVIIGD